MASTEQMQTRLLMQYIGVCTLLGRVSESVPNGDQNRYGIDKAMRDANNLFLCGSVDLFFQKSSRGGYAAFERSALLKTEPNAVAPYGSPGNPVREPAK